MHINLEKWQESQKRDDDTENERREQGILFGTSRRLVRNSLSIKLKRWY